MMLGPRGRRGQRFATVWLSAAFGLFSLKPQFALQGQALRDGSIFERDGNRAVKGTSKVNHSRGASRGSSGRLGLPFLVRVAVLLRGLVEEDGCSRETLTTARLENFHAPG
jgi:hypothetical protein